MTSRARLPTPSSTRRASSSPVRRRTPASSGSCRSTTSCACGYEGRVFATNRQGERVLGRRNGRRASTSIPDGAADLVFVCTPVGRQRRRPAGVRPQGHPSRVRDDGRLRRVGRRRPAGRARARRAGRRARHPARRARTARASCRRRPTLCAQIVAPYPPAGRIGVASQSGNIVSTFDEPRASRPGSASAGPSRPATPPPSTWPTTSTSSPTTTATDGRAWRTSRACATGAVLRPGAGRHAAAAARAGQGRCHGGRSAGRGLAHRRAGHRRPHLRRRHAPGRRDPCRHGRGSASRRRPRSPPSRCRAVPNVVVVTTAGGWGVVTADALDAASRAAR